MSTDGNETTEGGARQSSQAGARVDHVSVGERVAKGKAARAAVPRSAHAAWEPAAKRPGPVGLLEQQAKTRVPELVPLRYGRMMVTPFTFYRGAAFLMASDLSNEPRSGLNVQLCGDAHLSNFGAFAAPDRRLVFSLNDFDETLPGPFEWDVKRLAASFAVAGRDRGFDETTRHAVNLAVGRSYREAIAKYATMGNLAMWYTRIDIETLFAEIQKVATKEQRKRAEKNLAKTQSKDSLKAFGKLTEVVDGELRIVSDPPVIVPVEDLVSPDHVHMLDEFFRTNIRAYRRTLAGDRRKLLERYRFVHFARKVVGVGSVGTRAFIMLLVGRDDGDPLFLQFKEAEASVLEPFLGRSEFANHGQRVVEGQRLTQAASDITLGWIRTEHPIEGVKRDYYVRQLWDAKGSALVELMEPSALAHYATICGTELARAHARSGDAIAITSYLGNSNTFDRAIALFAESYANQNERDYETVAEAVADGTLKAESPTA